MSFFEVRETASFLHFEFSAPDSGNAFGLEVARELSRLQKQFKKWERAVIVTAAHPTLFCSGGNLSDYKKLKTKASGLNVNREVTKHLNDFGAWPVVKLALLEGDVLGGGLEWLARFDFRWSTPYALLSFWQKRIGLSPGWGGGRAWSGILGEAKLRTLLIEAELLSAERALNLGIVDRVVSGWKIRHEAEDWAAKLDPLSQLHKWSVAREAAIFSSLWHGPQHKSVLKRWKS